MLLKLYSLAINNMLEKLPGTAKKLASSHVRRAQESKQSV